MPIRVRADPRGPRIVALVGADGSGKTTQARRLEERLRASGVRARSVRPVFVLFDPYRLGGRTRASEGFRASPRKARLSRGGSGNEGMRPRASAGVFGLLGYLYGLASYAALRLTQRTVDIVVCDRYFYQFFYDLYGPSAWKVAGAFPRPDLVVWLDVGPEALADRLRGGPDGAEMSYLTSVIEFYRRAAETLGFRRIDGGAQETQVAEAIWRTVTEDMGRWHA